MTTRSLTAAGEATVAVNDDCPRKSAIVTVRDRKTVQRQREQQQMSKLMRGENPSPMVTGFPTKNERRSAIITKRSQQHPHLDITPEERDRLGAAADAMFQEFKRLIAAGLKEP
jgi:hypothetical protein